MQPFYMLIGITDFFAPSLAHVLAYLHPYLCLLSRHSSYLFSPFPTSSHLTTALLCFPFSCLFPHLLTYYNPYHLSAYLLLITLPIYLSLSCFLLITALHTCLPLLCLLPHHLSAYFFITYLLTASSPLCLLPSIPTALISLLTSHFNKDVHNTFHPLLLHLLYIFFQADAW